ncbi:glucose 1-dehydrogenase [Sporichthya brevicatena]|uniref:Glucose 1-dehydrogenase n=1 Tax=Sporichthya brevicatena TaxID=171442 RepID=A0ABN1GNM7_9ACTN
MFELDGKVAVVTGGGKGIGRGIARALADAGATVVIVGRDTVALRRTVEEIHDRGGEARYLQADLRDLSAPDRIIESVLTWHGRLDCWVNNAGSAMPSDVGPLLSITEDRWDRVVDLNLKSAFFASQAACRAMPKGGSIINISSRSGSQPNPNTGQYGASKAALENLTMTMAVEWGHLGIRVNAVAPGLVLTELDETPDGVMYSAERRQRQIELIPAGRLGVVDDIGPLCVYLASDESAWVSGAIIPVNGGSRVSVGYLSYLKKVRH